MMLYEQTYKQDINDDKQTRLKIPKTGNKKSLFEKGETTQWQKEKELNDKTLHRKLKIEQHNSTEQPPSWNMI
jgi:hypothetical protein